MLYNKYAFLKCPNGGMVDAEDLKSSDCNGRAGSSPVSGTICALSSGGRANGF